MNLRERTFETFQGIVSLAAGSFLASKAYLSSFLLAIIHAYLLSSYPSNVYIQPISANNDPMFEISKMFFAFDVSDVVFVSVHLTFLKACRVSFERQHLRTR